MPREPENYRIVLEGLRQYFPGKEAVTIPEAADYIGVKYERLKYDPTYPRFKCGKQEKMLLTLLAKRLS